MGIALEVYRTCRDVVLEHDGGRIDRARLGGGWLGSFYSDLLDFAWQAVTADGPDHGATLEIDFRPARQYCRSCDSDTDRAEGSWLRLCPRCGMPLEVSGGDELDVLEVSFRDSEQEEAT